MFKAFFWGSSWRLRARAFFGAAALFLLLCLQVKVAVVFNHWNGTFFDSLSHATERPAAELWDGLKLLGFIALCDIILATAAGCLGFLFAVWWRKALTAHYIPRWKRSEVRIEGASQRIQKDPGEFASIIEDIGLDFCRSFLTLFAFLPVLWGLGAQITIGGFTGSGMLLAIALAMSIGGMGISWLVGRALPRLETENQKTEAAFRKQLVHAEDRRKLIEAGRGWRILFEDVLTNYYLQIRHKSYVTAWSVGYAKIMMLLPYGLCLSGVHSGIITLALLMQIVHAFGEVQGGFSFLVKNWTRVTRGRSVYLRLRQFELALEEEVRADVAAAEVVYISEARTRRLKHAH